MDKEYLIVIFATNLETSYFKIDKCLFLKYMQKIAAVKAFVTVPWFKIKRQVQTGSETLYTAFLQYIILVSFQELELRFEYSLFSLHC